MSVVPPQTTTELMSRAYALEGHTLFHIAQTLGQIVPPNLRGNKGWVGQLLEEALGASGGSRAIPDFPGLGVELKTVPIDTNGKVKESTYVCTAPMDNIAANWESSWVCQKLSHVLWCPIIVEKDRPLSERRIGRPVLWEPSPEESSQLQSDWEELTEMMVLGELWMISGHRGRVLQLRPKAASSKSTRWVLDDEANWVKATPMGFYLRTAFTKAILAENKQS